VTTESGEERKGNYVFDELETICNEPIPTIFVDGYWGVIKKENSVRLNMVEERFDPGNNKVYKYIVARLVMPVDVLHGIASSLSNLSAELKAAGDGKQ
jgi:hypothetical protein